MQCDYRFHQINGQCIHYLLPPDTATIFGSIILFFISGLSSIAGLGGGGPSLIVLLFAFKFTTKDSTIVVFACILGATMGNMMTQMKRSLNGEPLIKYEYAFVSIPLMFSGAFIGVMINKVFPSIITCLLIMSITAMSLKKILKKFIERYKQQTQQNNIQINKIILESINPFHKKRNQYIFVNITILVLAYLSIQILRGSQKFPSIINIGACQPLYWIICLISFLFTLIFAFYNYQSLKKWIILDSQQVTKDEITTTITKTQTQRQLNSQYYQKVQNISKIQKIHNPILDHKISFVFYNILGGIFSGFGMGGGVVLVPMYRNLGMSPLQATSTCAFGVFITAIINCFQGICFGIITISDFGYFFILTFIGSSILSRIISNYLQKINRLSLVDLLLFLLLVLTVINIPYFLWAKFQKSQFNTDTILSFTSFC